jgi:hypothetical protein
MSRKFLNGIDLNNQRATGFADPVGPTDGANRQFVENIARGMTYKEAVRAASTANINLAAPGATVDGVALTASDPILGRFLAKDQTTGAEKGIYIWNGAAVPATRSLDADTGTELRPGTTVFVTEGTLNADKQFVITSDVAITIGTTAMTWTVFGGGTTYTASNGAVMVGSDVRGVVVASGGLIVGASGFAIDTSVVSRKVSGSMGNGALTVIPVTHSLGTKDVSVTMREVATDAVLDTDWVATDINTVTFTFATAPTASQYRWTIQG